MPLEADLIESIYNTFKALRNEHASNLADAHRKAEDAQKKRDNAQITADVVQKKADDTQAKLTETQKRLSEEEKSRSDLKKKYEALVKDHDCLKALYEGNLKQFASRNLEFEEVKSQLAAEKSKGLGEKQTKQENKSCSSGATDVEAGLEIVDLQKTSDERRKSQYLLENDSDELFDENSNTESIQQFTAASQILRKPVSTTAPRPRVKFPAALMQPPQGSKRPRRVFEDQCSENMPTATTPLEESSELSLTQYRIFTGLVREIERMWADHQLQLDLSGSVPNFLFREAFQSGRLEEIKRKLDQGEYATAEVIEHDLKRFLAHGLGSPMIADQSSAERLTGWINTRMEILPPGDPRKKTYVILNNAEKNQNKRPKLHW